MPRRWLAPEFFTDEKMKKATVPERLLAAAIIANQDDDGRLRGDPAYLRAIAFLYDDYPLEEVRRMRAHLTQVNPNIIVYENDDEEYIQLKRYKRYQNPRYYHPSKFPAPRDWPFEDSNQRVTTPQPIGNQEVPIQEHQAVTLDEGEGKGKDKNLDLDLDKGKGEGPERHPSPSLTADTDKILKELTRCFKIEWGKVPAEAPDTVISRVLGARESAQLRDLAKNLSAGGVPLDFIKQAFREAASHEKFHISYVRAILLDWLGVERNRSP